MYAVFETSDEPQTPPTVPEIVKVNVPPGMNGPDDAHSHRVPVPGTLVTRMARMSPNGPCTTGAVPAARTGESVSTKARFWIVALPVLVTSSRYAKVSPTLRIAGDCDRATDRFATEGATAKYPALIEPESVPHATVPLA